MFQHETGFDAKVRGKIVDDRDAFQFVVQALYGGHEELKGVDAALRVSHIEFAAGAIGQPVEVSLGGSDARAISVRAEFAAIFIGIETVFEFNDANANVFVEQEPDGALGGARARGIGVEIEVEIGGVASI
jgi:hypothetical protein